MFAQLDTKSVYSFMDSVVDLNSYVARAKELGYQALGLMDRDNLYAAYHFVRWHATSESSSGLHSQSNALYVKELQDNQTLYQHPLASPQ